jgi:pyruvate dehydrogenase complex dehydrogenase (E1) component
VSEQETPGPATPRLEALREVERRVLWLATAIVHHANRVRPNPSGVKVGGHQASSASLVTIMTSLWFRHLRAVDRVSVKPHASPVLHAVNYLLGELDATYLTTLRELGGLQSYPSRAKDPDPVDYSTGSVGIGATAPIWGAIARRYVNSLNGPPDATPPADCPRQYCLVGDAELDEGAVWEAIMDPAVAELGEVTWIVPILVGTPSGVSLAPEGGAHQSVITPSIGLEQPGIVAYEPAFAIDAEWTLLACLSQLGHPGGCSAYLRLSTRPVDQSLAGVPDDPAARERRRRQVVAGAYPLRRTTATATGTGTGTSAGTGRPAVTIAAMGAVTPEALAAAARLDELGVPADVVCVTSPGLLFRALRARQGSAPGDSAHGGASWILPAAFPAERAAPMVTVLDGHPHTLAFLATINQVPSVTLGVTAFGQSGSLDDVYRSHGIDTDSIVRAALDATG